MHFFVSGKQIAGTTDNPDMSIAGFAILEGPDLPPEFLYFDGFNVKLKPARTSEFAIWDIDDCEWKTPEAEEPTIEEIKAQKIAQLDLACFNQISSGFTSEALGSPHFYSSKLENQLNMIGATMLGGAAGTAIAYTCTNIETQAKKRVLHTINQLRQVLGDGAAIKEKLIGRYHELAELVNAATTIDDIAKINW